MYNPEYYKKNREHILAYLKQYYQAPKAKKRKQEYYQKNREHKIEYAKQYRKKYPEKAYKYSMDSYYKHLKENPNYKKELYQRQKEYKDIYTPYYRKLMKIKKEILKIEKVEDVEIKLSIKLKWKNNGTNI